MCLQKQAKGRIYYFAINCGIIKRRIRKFDKKNMLSKKCHPFKLVLFIVS